MNSSFPAVHAPKSPNEMKKTPLNSLYSYCVFFSANDSTPYLFTTVVFLLTTIEISVPDFLISE